jgi:uncharacterized membrane protein YtjA (UPF0391 family)
MDKFIGHVFAKREGNSLSNQIYRTMIKWSITFLVIALIAGVLGFGGIAAGAAGIAKIIFYIFLVVLAVTVVMHFVRRV